MLAPNPSLYYNGRASFVKPLYLKKAKYEKPCLYQVPYDQDALANIFTLNSAETLIFEEEIKDLLMPLVEKTKANANEFEKTLKEKMFDDLQYVQSLEKELDELQSNKTEFSNEYDPLLQEYAVSMIQKASNLSPDAVRDIQTASPEPTSHLSPDAVWIIQTTSLEPGRESSSIFKSVSYLVRFLP
ncbi:hypothetical protein Tco_0511116 [Tanacetum coccineum]